MFSVSTSSAQSKKHGAQKSGGASALSASCQKVNTRRSFDISQMHRVFTVRRVAWLFDFHTRRYRRGFLLVGIAKADTVGDVFILLFSQSARGARRREVLEVLNILSMRL